MQRLMIALLASMFLLGITAMSTSLSFADETQKTTETKTDLFGGTKKTETETKFDSDGKRTETKTETKTTN